MKYRIMICIAATVICAACDKPFEMDLPLSVAGRHITLSKDGGSTHVLVYSDGNWTAAFDKEVNWAAIDRTSGRGNGESAEETEYKGWREYIYQCVMPHYIFVAFIL